MAFLWPVGTNWHCTKKPMARRNSSIWLPSPRLIVADDGSEGVALRLMRPQLLWSPVNGATDSAASSPLSLVEPPNFSLRVVRPPTKDQKERKKKRRKVLVLLLIIPENRYKVSREVMPAGSCLVMPHSFTVVQELGAFLADANTRVELVVAYTACLQSRALDACHRCLWGYPRFGTRRPLQFFGVHSTSLLLKTTQTGQANDLDCARKSDDFLLQFLGG